MLTNPNPIEPFQSDLIFNAYMFVFNIPASKWFDTVFRSIFASMGTIRQRVSLEGVRFFAYHGFYQEEQILGTDFILDIETELEVFGSGGDDISNTVNYERLYQIASEKMNIPRKLLETVAHEILEQIRHEFLAVKHIRVAIRKMHPPFHGEVANSSIELIFSR